MACRENAIPCARYSLGGEKVHQRGTLAALPLDAITKYGMECNCTLPLKHRARILNSEQERVIRVNFPQFRASLLEKEWEMSNPLAVILEGLGKVSLRVS